MCKHIYEHVKIKNVYFIIIIFLNIEIPQNCPAVSSLQIYCIYTLISFIHLLLSHQIISHKQMNSFEIWRQRV